MNYTKAEFETAYKDILQRCLLGVAPTDNPKAYILGGQPGAGKTQFQRQR